MFSNSTVLISLMDIFLRCSILCIKHLRLENFERKLTLFDALGLLLCSDLEESLGLSFPWVESGSFFRVELPLLGERNT